MSNTTLNWRKSSKSVGQGACVELAKLDTGEIAMRNSNRPNLGYITFTQDEVDAFLEGAKACEFDDMTVA